LQLQFTSELCFQKKEEKKKEPNFKLK